MEQGKERVSCSPTISNLSWLTSTATKKWLEDSCRGSPSLEGPSEQCWVDMCLTSWRSEPVAVEGFGCWLSARLVLVFVYYCVSGKVCGRKMDFNFCFQKQPFCNSCGNVHSLTICGHKFSNQMRRKCERAKSVRMLELWKLNTNPPSNISHFTACLSECTYSCLCQGRHGLCTYVCVHSMPQLYLRCPFARIGTVILVRGLDRLTCYSCYKCWTVINGCVGGRGMNLIKSLPDCTILNCITFVMITMLFWYNLDSKSPV